LIVRNLCEQTIDQSRFFPRRIPMKAAVLYKYKQPLVIEEIDLDPPKQGEVLVRMTSSGVCHSDYHTM
jgi:Zn-dependent alcohol dehydrogenase